MSSSSVRYGPEVTKEVGMVRKRVINLFDISDLIFSNSSSWHNNSNNNKNNNNMYYSCNESYS